MIEKKLFVESYGKNQGQNIFVRSGNSIELQKNHAVNHENFLSKASSIFQEIFLPQGYPDSVSDDYLEYQIWDTCQAFCSTITGTLTMRAVMEGVGVGSDTATPLAAAITWIIKDGTGMVGRIAFAWLKGSELDSECKQWRLFADVINDIAMGIELSVPYFKEMSMWMLCCSTCMKSLVGVAGGATRAALTSHQAKRGNLADVSAKDSSQETLVNLCASFLGILLLQAVEGVNVGVLFLILTTFHIYFNYQAVKCLKMDKFNTARLLLTIKEHLKSGKVSDLATINRLEPVILGFTPNTMLFCGFNIYIGHSVKDLLLSNRTSCSQFEFFASNCSDEYILLPDVQNKNIYVVADNTNKFDIVKSYYHAVLLALSISYVDGLQLPVFSKLEQNTPISHLVTKLERVSDAVNDVFIICKESVDEHFASFRDTSVSAGWNMHYHLLQVEEYHGVWKHHL